MTFSSLNAAVMDLRNVLRTFVGPDALGEINLRPPVGEDSEASFLRLVAWSYVLIFEVGRVTIPYLMKLPTRNAAVRKNSDRTRSLVRELRTWSFHNLGLTEARDLALSRRVHTWFQQTCGACPPESGEDWTACCQDLCGHVVELVGQCKSAMDVALSAEDGGVSVVDDLRRRIERVWPAYRFDEIIEDVGTRLGIRVDSRKFRESRLARWRDYVDAIPEGDDLERHVVRLIERELLDYGVDVLPIDGRDVMEVLGLEPGREVGDVLREARELWRRDGGDRETLLGRLVAERANSGKAR